jgi:ERF superfamily
MEVKQSACEGEPAGDDTAQTSVNGRAKEGKGSEEAPSESQNGKVRKERTPSRRTKHRSARAGSANCLGAQIDGRTTRGRTAFVAPIFAQLSLRQKLAVVRRRISYVQKRGRNERKNYNYVTAADIAGAVGDILAELGVIVAPRLESISHEPSHMGRSGAEHVARVVMAYTFMDVDTAEEITVKVAGEGLDAGDKAPYKAMTGALKYALLQSFLLATGDDPENESAQPQYARSPQLRAITEQEAKAFYELVEKTGTELERVLEYYKVSSVGEMTEAIYHRAMETLGKKLKLMERKASNNGQS